jgi:hypothetical protein
MLLAALWGAIVLISFAGWGELAGRVTRFKSAGWGFRFATGTAVVISLGGVLNLAHAISRQSVFCVLAIGAAYAVMNLRLPRRLRKPSPAAAVLVCSVLCLVGVRYAGSLRGSTDCPGAFECEDDLRAYLVFPNRMLQIGTQGADPFSFRRVKSSLGAQNFLLVCLRSALPDSSLNLLESGIGSVMVSAVLFEIAESVEVAAAGSLLFLLLPSPIVNLTSVYVSLALFLNLYRILIRQNTRDALLVALHASALIALKSTNLPPLAVLLVPYYALDFFVRKRGIRGALLAGGATVALLLPWMIDMYRTSGTALYPVFGSGYAQWAYPSFRHPYGHLPFLQWFRNLPRPSVIALLIFAAASYYCARKREEIGTSMALVLASLTGTLITVGALAGYSPYRFAFPFLMAAVLVQFMSALPALSLMRGPARGALAIWLLVGCYLLIGRPANLAAARYTYGRAIQFMRTPADRPRSYAGMENALPPGSAVLARLERPYLLDFRRHRIYTIDWPGGSSLPPGLPLENSEELSAYLTSHSIRFLAYDYATNANFSDKRIVLTQPKFPYFLRVSMGLALKFNARLAELGKTRRRIYDDGKTYVLDLTAPVNSF